MSNITPPVVMIFAASDPTGGAGLQADLMTVSSMGCHGLTVVTGLTVQDTTGVDDFMAIDSDFVNEQARVVLEDMPVASFKIGVLGSVETVAVVAEIVSDYPDVPLVLDPVLTSGRGDHFADDDVLSAIRDLLIPQTTIITPNSIEARRLASHGEESDDDATSLSLETCAARLIEWGSEFVLITGTHENTAEVINVLYGDSGVMRSDAWQRLVGSYHGSGCTLASALAALLANGLDIPEAAREAQEYTWQALAAGFRPGMGQYLPDRFFWARELQAANGAQSGG
ncbi:MAG: hydroxymethylpyrimidine/phosphomethylpyrimidine kinase [Burkholderiaceae bacterium]|jgi:hydroxymethylpyrimidine/phosphomethylpyrimidine kinase